MKNNIIKHLTFRLVIPLFILFLIWKIGNIEYAHLEEVLFFSFFSSFLFFIVSIFILNETLDFHRNKKLLQRNLNIALLILFIPFSVFMAIVCIAIANF